ncbi:hypothetical protein P43SY_012109 [Pythium insidiosum]|uniref:Lipase-like C-terminal domain-containing protein n=1 Tax=Pythium insidiosum TaxID=114742 RepID=A0AAD5LA08_PYTIN|nr:hypothetical protein P43SY_012109 [Pythium insidiosum]
MTRTRHPVVLIHGVFGYGKRRPLWNTWSPYWPEAALQDMDANHLIVDVGVLSSDHDRACEAFYQLYGGRVDYGEEHSTQSGHSRYGATFETALHPNWSAENPVHLLGHSFGATTAIELYQLLCQDAFGVGSDHRWVKSIVCIAGPLSGTTLTHLFGLHDGKMVAHTLGHLIGASLCFWHRLHTHFPVLSNIFEYRMPQWEFVTSYREILSASSRILTSPDLALYDILPARRLERNSRLIEMNKPFLVSIATSTRSTIPLVECLLGAKLVAIVAAAVAHAWQGDTIELKTLSLFGIGALVIFSMLRHRIRRLDYASISVLTFLRVQMSLCVRYLHEIFDGFDHQEWEPNDGAVNVKSMLQPLQAPCPLYESDISSSSGSGDETSSSASTVGSFSTVRPLLSIEPLDLDAFGKPDDCEYPAENAIAVETEKLPLQRGRWYVHQVEKNHLAGTHFDADAPALYGKLLRLIATEFE